MPPSARTEEIDVAQLLFLLVHDGPRVLACMAHKRWEAADTLFF
jgi:hypothetical protein